MPHLAEEAQVALGFGPVDLKTAANDGDYVSMKGHRRVAILFVKGTGTAGDDPTLTLQQASAVAGTGAKDLNFTEIYKKQGADLTAVGQWTKVTQDAANTYTDATSAEEAAIWMVIVDAQDLDADNDFDCIRATVADIGDNAQLGCLLYILTDPAYAGAAPASVLAD